MLNQMPRTNLWLVVADKKLSLAINKLFSVLDRKTDTVIKKIATRLGLDPCLEVGHDQGFSIWSTRTCLFCKKEIKLINRIWVCEGQVSKEEWARR